MRKIILNDGLGMGDTSIVFDTNAPISRLKELEKLSTELARKGEEVPIWADILEEEGYIFEYVDDHQHITGWGTSTSWKEKYFPKIKEEYTIMYD